MAMVRKATHFMSKIEIKLNNIFITIDINNCIFVCVILHRYGGFVAFVIYMVTTLSLYVPDWSFVDYKSSKPKRYTVINIF
jgi:biotin transporter BioY